MYQIKEKNICKFVINLDNVIMVIISQKTLRAVSNVYLCWFRRTQALGLQDTSIVVKFSRLSLSMTLQMRSQLPSIQLLRLVHVSLKKIYGFK